MTPECGREICSRFLRKRRVLIEQGPILPILEGCGHTAGQFPGSDTRLANPFANGFYS